MRDDEWGGEFPPVEVMLTCVHEYMDERKVEVLNIEEDITGRDLLTFRCPECGQVHKAYRVSRR